jgi:hypothetical protein
LDGYAFSYPEGWIEVRGSGADIFFRDPVNLDENVSVEMSSPSSSRYKGVDDLGSPADAARKVLNQYLTEFMSTRIGVRRDSKILSSASRIASDGKLYYDIEVRSPLLLPLSIFDRYVFLLWYTTLLLRLKSPNV